MTSPSSTRQPLRAAGHSRRAGPDSGGAVPPPRSPPAAVAPVLPAPGAGARRAPVRPGRGAGPQSFGEAYPQARERCRHAGRDPRARPRRQTSPRCRGGSSARKTTVSLVNTVRMRAACTPVSCQRSLQVSGFRFQVSGFRVQGSGSGFRFQVQQGPGLRRTYHAETSLSAVSAKQPEGWTPTLECMLQHVPGLAVNSHTSTLQAVA